MTVRAPIRRLLSLALLLPASTFAQTLTEWTEGPGPLGLGYPVPIPVDTPLPFAGFRTYDGLFTRHQSLAAEVDDVRGQVVGQTESGRDIWAYLLGDADGLTATGLPEGAIYTQGGIHAREWQSPEVVTGIMERLVDQRDDNFLHRYLLDNLNMVIVPVLNVDGYLQTQRFPSTVQLLGSQPRDGRMRRKNMRGVDEDVLTTEDYLLGIDLNRNSPPYWATSGSSSSDPESIVHHGAEPQSESEIRTMVAAAELGPGDRLRMYTDVHSFSQVHFSVRTSNLRRNVIQSALLSDFSGFHVQLPGSKFYVDVPGASGRGIGSTDEFFAEIYDVPSWTLEIEPSGTLQPDAHPDLPGCGADYGGFASNCHDGFVLPESEIQRVRENLGQTFPIAYYHQAGPPSVTAVRVFEPTSGAVVFDAEWDVVSPTQRQLFSQQLQPLALDQSYELWVAFDKPMRWRSDAGAVAALPGQSGSGLSTTSQLEVGEAVVAPGVGQTQWLNEAGGAPAGYHRYRDDAFRAPLTLSGSALASAVTGTTPAELVIDARDMVGLRVDGDPATAVDFFDGSWQRYENDIGGTGDAGGPDRKIALNLTDAAVAAPFGLEPGISAAWFDITHDGEGLLIELLADDRAVVYWFTYDREGRQRWFISTGEIRGNMLHFPELLVAEGGVFGPAFDAAAVNLTDAGSATVIWSDCNTATLRHDVDRRTQRQAMTRLTTLAGLDCSGSAAKSASTAVSKGTAAAISGSWFDPQRSGEGFVVEALADDRAIAYWFTYDGEGNQAWIVADGILNGTTFTAAEALISSGGIFGDDFDPATVELTTWGSITLDFDCAAGELAVSYASPLDGFGSGELTYRRLTELSGLGGCG
ncbi:MAG: M14 family zinc carboxypeptidase [Pseudomonadota bacterium]